MNECRTIVECYIAQIPQGERCEGDKVCGWLKRNYMLRLDDIRDYWCTVYGMSPKDGKKVDMCLEVTKLELTPKQRKVQGI